MALSNGPNEWFNHIGLNASNFPNGSTATVLTSQRQYYNGPSGTTMLALGR